MSLKEFYSGKKLIIAGPCAMEDHKQMLEVASCAYHNGIEYLRAAIFKPRTRPESFQGIGADVGLEILSDIKSEFKPLHFVSEVCSSDQFKLIKNHIQGIQIGTRSMQNFELLKFIAREFNPEIHHFILLKRGFANTLEEWIASAEYLIAGGVPQHKIILCERGIRSASGVNGVIIDYASAYLAKKQYGFKVIIDPSHGTKQRSLVLPMAEMALNNHFDGVILEAHPRPSESVSDAAQAIGLTELAAFMRRYQSAHATTGSQTFF